MRASLHVDHMFKTHTKIHWNCWKRKRNCLQPTTKTTHLPKIRTSRSCRTPYSIEHPQVATYFGSPVIANIAKCVRSVQKPCVSFICPEQRTYNYMSRRRHALYSVKLPCSMRWQKNVYACKARCCSIDFFRLRGIGVRLDRDVAVLHSFETAFRVHPPFYPRDALDFPWRKSALQ